MEYAISSEPEGREYDCKVLGDLERSPYLIAEAGVNHNGSLDEAKKLVDAAVWAGADAVKFQSFNASRLVRPATSLVPYQEGSAADHYALLEGLELSRQDQSEIFNYCKNAGITFLSTPYSADDARFLLDLGVKTFKIASADIVDLELHSFLCDNGVQVLASTGMSNRYEVERLVTYYARRLNIENLWLMQCVSNYPASLESQNLRVLYLFRDLVGERIGFSDHTSSSLSALVAIGAGALVFEKHLTLNRKSSGPDHAASLEPKQFSAYVEDLRLAFMALGTGLKEPQVEELEMRKISRKGVYLARDVESGEVVDWPDVSLMRPANGMDAWAVLEDFPVASRSALEKGEPFDPDNHE